MSGVLGVLDPLLFLAGVAGISAAALIAHRMVRHAHRQRLRQLAREWRMHYVAVDVFQLASKIASQFPVAGAAEVRVLDVIYGLEGERYRYVFTAEYAEGPGVGQSRYRRAMLCTEPKEGSGGITIKAAAEGPGLVEQYRQLAISG